MGWNCASCGYHEEAPADPQLRLLRAAKWTKVNYNTHLCPACTKSVNRDCDKEMRHVPHGSGRDREQTLYATWWQELLASRPK